MSDYSAAVNPLLAMGILALRNNTVLPRLVNMDFSRQAQQKTDVININVPAAVPSRDVTPGPTPPANTNTVPTKVPLTLSNWREATFEVSDKEMAEINEGILPMEASEAIASLADDVDQSIFATYPAFYGLVGQKTSSAFDDPFEDGTTFAATDAGRLLAEQKAGTAERRFVMNPAAEARAKSLRAYQDSSWSGDPAVIIDGRLNRKLGFDNWMNQNVPTHTAGTAAAATVTWTSNTAAGAKTGTMAVSTGTATVVVGDIFTLANHNQQYTITAAQTLTTGGAAVAFEPALAVASDGSGTPISVSVEPSHKVNLAFQRNAIAFASRPLLDSVLPGTGHIIRSVSDPISGLTLRIEVARHHRQTRWAYDILWGTAVVRPQLGIRVAGKI